MAQPSQFEASTEAYLTASLHMPLNADVVDQVFFIAPVPCELVFVSEAHGTAGSDGGAVTLQVERLQGTEAAGGNGDALLSATIDLKGTADTVQTGTIVSDGTQELAAGDRLGVNITGTATAVAGACVTAILRRV